MFATSPTIRLFGMLPKGEACHECLLRNTTKQQAHATTSELVE
jgi:hypothetical protein